MAKKIVDEMMNEVIIHGGIPLSRANVYRLVKQSTKSSKAANMFAFGSHIKKAPKGTKPYTLSQAKRIFKIK